jgi:CheY-like chemotaxis protein
VNSPEANPSPQTRRSGNPQLILSVDDEPVLLHTRWKILQREGYDVLSAADGKQSLEFLAAYPIDLVLLDYNMPGMDGGTVSREIKLRKPLVPVIMVSANPVPEEALHWADGFVAKGEGPALLLAQTRELSAPARPGKVVAGEVTLRGRMAS